MKLRNQDEVKQDNNTTSNVQITDDEKEKGNFKHFNISKKTIKKLQGNSSIEESLHCFEFFVERNVEFLFPVQSQSYQYIYEQKDCLVQAYTGTGKTLAFALPTVEILQNDSSVKLIRGRAPRVLVLAPTRELSKTEMV